MVSAIWEEGPAVVIAMHTSLSPSDDEWNRYLGHVEAAMQKHSQVHFLTITDGATPSFSQRADLNKRLGGHNVKDALITDALFIRNIARARGLVSPQMQAFAPSEVQQAFAHLELTPVQVDACMQAIYTLQASLPPLRTYREMHAQQKTRAGRVVAERVPFDPMLRRQPAPTAR